MALFSSFYNPRHPRQFDHKPIYWDPHKEEIDKRVRKIKREMGMDDGQESLEEYKTEIKGSFVEGTSHLKRSIDRGDESRSRNTRNVRLAVIIAVLFVIFWYLFPK